MVFKTRAKKKIHIEIMDQTKPKILRTFETITIDFKYE